MVNNGQVRQQDDLGHDGRGQDDLGHDDRGQDDGHPRLSLSQVTYDKMEQIQDAVLAHHRHQFEGIKKVKTLEE